MIPFFTDDGYEHLPRERHSKRRPAPSPIDGLLAWVAGQNVNPLLIVLFIFAVAFGCAFFGLAAGM
jgi:hypothetical protein